MGARAWVRTWGGLALLAALAAWAGPAAGQGAGTATGTVWDEEGAPLAQARVVVLESGRGALTDARGRFRLAGLPAGRHVVEVSLIGYAPARRAVEVGGRAAPAPLEVRLERTPLSIPGVQVTATPTGREPAAVVQATTELSGRALEREMGATLAQTLRAQPGISMRSMGPAATAPVMRGLTGDRVLVLEDGQRTADLAGSADDHGVTIDPLAAQRVEVVRGPATLLYGNNALGGVVNVISGDVPTNVPLGVEWSATGQVESAYPGGTGTARVALPLGERWVLGARGGGRGTGDMRIAEDPVLGDRLENTGFRTAQGAVGLGYVGQRGLGGVAARAYDFRYGLPVPPGADPVTLDGGRLEALGRWEVEPGSARVPSLRLDGTVQRYRHDELDTRDGAVLQRFSLDTRTLNLLVRQGALGPFAEGAWGVSGLLKSYAATGPAALTPAADSRAAGVFAFQEAPIGRVALQLGARFDRYEVESRGSETFGPGVARRFDAFSGSVGASVPLGAGWSAGASVARSFRAPTVEELFSGAAHAGTGSVEFGNPALRAERGRALEAVLRVQDARWNGQLAVFHNAIDGFVHLVARGDSLVGGVLLPVLAYGQAPAVLRGVEGSLEWAARPELALGVMGDAVRAERRDGTPLSYMPPPRLGASARWDDGALSLGADLHHEFRQDRVGAAEERPTPAHTTLRLSAGLRLVAGRRVHSITLRAENLTDAPHREATSRIKDFAPGPGRNVAVLYRVMGVN